MSRLLLGVNIDHVATLRQARGTSYPDVVQAAGIAIGAGADSITVHLREDRRHIQDRDVRNLKDSISAPLNLEMAISDEMLAIAEAIKPDYCCFVPEKREELTTEGGLDILANQQKVRHACTRMQAAGVRPSLFIDPDQEQIKAAKTCGAEVIEIHTGRYADAVNGNERRAELEKIKQSAVYANRLDLTVNAGHGLNYENISSIVSIAVLHELNIGHAIVARAVFVGLAEAVREMQHLLDRSL